MIALLTGFTRQLLSLGTQLWLFLDKYTGKGSTICISLIFLNRHRYVVGKPVWPRKPRFRCLPPPWDTWLCIWSQICHLPAPPLPLSAVSYIYIQQCKRASSKPLLMSFTDISVRLQISVLKGGVYPVTISFSGWCQRIGLVFTARHSCNSSLQEGHVIDLAADVLSKLGNFASLFTLKAELTYPRFKLPTGSAFLRWYLKECGKVLPVNTTCHCLSQMAEITLNFLNKKFLLNFYLRVSGRML